MKKIDVVFLMTSLDSGASFKTTGELKDNRIIFSDDEKNKHFIIIHKDHIEYHKRGSMNMKYVFDLKQTTIGTYSIDGNNFKFVIETKELLKKENEIMIRYDLLLDDEMVNQSTLLIKYR